MELGVVTIINKRAYIVIDIQGPITVSELYYKITELLDLEEYEDYDKPFMRVAEIKGFCALNMAPEWDIAVNSYKYITHGMITLANGVEYSSELIIGTAILEKQHTNGQH